MPPYNPSANKVCANCDREGHGLAECIWPDLEGVICGCPACNDAGHSIEDCSFVEKTDEAIFRWLVTERNNKPAIFSPAYCGLELAQLACRKSNSLPPRPWTKTFALKFRADKATAREGIRYRTGAQTPTDSKTDTVEKLLALDLTEERCSPAGIVDDFEDMEG